MNVSYKSEISKVKQLTSTTVQLGVYKENTIIM